MKINIDSQKAQLLVSNGDPDKKNVNGNYSGTSIQPTGDPVNISRLISNLNQLMTNDINTQSGNERIAALKSSIDAGTYSVKGIAVASKMLGVEHLV